MTGTTSIAAGVSGKALFQVKVAVAFPCAGMEGTTVADAAMISPFLSRTKTMVRTFANGAVVGFESIASTRGALTAPLCVVFDTVGTLRSAAAMRNHLR